MPCRGMYVWNDLCYLIKGEPGARGEEGSQGPIGRPVSKLKNFIMLWGKTWTFFPVKR